MKSTILGLSAICATILAGAVSAQSLSHVGSPAEYPSADFRGSQYVDSRGCVFIRVGLSGATDWVPRVDRRRQAMCGFQPTGGATQSAPPAQSATRASASVRVIDIPQTAQAATAAPQPQPQMPTLTRPTTVPSAVAPSAAPSSVVPAVPAPRQITKAQACAGRSGILPGVVHAQTREPVDCGPAPQSPVIAPAAAAPAIAPLREQRVGASSGLACLNAMRSGAALPQGEHRCAPQGTSISSGVRSVSPTVPSGPVGQPTQPTAVPQPSAPSAAVPQQPGSDALAQPSPWACLEALKTGHTIITGPDGRQIRCAPQSVSPSGRSRDGASLQDGQGGRGALPDRSGQMRVAQLQPSSQPRLYGATRPAGWVSVWSDGRLNPHRGVAVARF